MSLTAISCTPLLFLFLLSSLLVACDLLPKRDVVADSVVTREFLDSLVQDQLVAKVTDSTYSSHFYGIEFELPESMYFVSDVEDELRRIKEKVPGDSASIEGAIHSVLFSCSTFERTLRVNVRHRAILNLTKSHIEFYLYGIRNVPKDLMGMQIIGTREISRRIGGKECRGAEVRMVSDSLKITSRTVVVPTATGFVAVEVVGLDEDYEERYESVLERLRVRQRKGF